MRSLIETLSKACLAAVLLVAAHPLVAAEPWDALRQGGVVILMRHATTEPGTGDPPGFRIDDCATQRPLSAAGRAEAKAFGAMLAARNVRPVAVFSSAWCRCMDTATLAVPDVPVKNLPALDSVFMDSSREPTQTRALRQAMDRLPAAGVTVWVTHQANATALTGEYLGMGEALVIRPEGGTNAGNYGAGKFRVLGRLKPPVP